MYVEFGMIITTKQAKPVDVSSYVDAYHQSNIQSSFDYLYQNPTRLPTAYESEMSNT